MKKTKRNILMLAGILATVSGILWFIPLALEGKYTGASISMILVIAGLILIAIGFGD